MKRFIDVHMGEVMAGKEDAVLHSDANNACLVIAAYDSVHKIGGLAHAMFVSTNGVVRRKNQPKSRDASSAIDEMIKDMELLGSNKEDIKICLVTGENVPHEKDDPDYQKTIDNVINILKEKDIKFGEKTVTDIGDMHVALDVGTGTISFI